ncbi:MAG: hypothetical protein FGM14_16990 [Flavobacteriales bacterium]|nr:hypothetical protein [Flavobacteriales bacterium]
MAESQTFIIYYVIIGTLFIAGLVVTLIMFHILNRQRTEKLYSEHELQRLEASIKAAEEERERMAYNFHDAVIPMVVSLKSNVHVLLKQTEKGIVEPENFTKINSLTNSVLDIQRSIIHQLAPRLLYKGGLAAAIGEYLQTINQFPVDLSVADDDSLTVKEQADFGTYSIVLELVNNIIKHETISELEVFLRIENKGVEITLKHNGIGLSQADFERLSKEKKGYGLSSIQRKLSYLNGSIVFQQFEEGTIIFIIIPPKK